MKTKISILLIFLMTCTFWLVGCKSDDSGSSDDDTKTAFSGVVVDPYIVGAVFCEDKNNNGSCDADEQVSTASNASGVFSFASQVTVGSTLIVKTQGKHNGITYTIDLSRKIDSTADVSGQVVSPLTTLAARSLTNAQIATMLQTAGLASITAADITTDPMSGMASLTGTITEAQVVKLRSSIAVYALLRIMNGSTTMKALTGAELYASAMTNGHAVNEILKGVVTLVKAGLDPALLTTIQNQLNASQVTLPAVTMGDVAKTAVAIVDYIAKTGYETCNATTGDAATKVTAAMAAVQTKTNNGAKIATWASQLGDGFYAARNKSALEQYRAYMGAYPHIVAGLDCSSGTFVIDASGSASCYTE